MIYLVKDIYIVTCYTLSAAHCGHDVSCGPTDMVLQSIFPEFACRRILRVGTFALKPLPSLRQRCASFW
ncbi:hypothetical protein RHECNPAF_890085 [Rhizobium etli CNPAF512]|nr:hypothetical protein RHECNPAF_890085 [Rhizobium etli CNPAF512]